MLPVMKQGDPAVKFHVSFDAAAGGVIINIIDDMNGNAFTTLLETSISQARQHGKTLVWLHLPPELGSLRKLADKEGFHPCDDGSHRLLYAIPQPNLSHVAIDIKQEGDANTREENPLSRALYMLPAKDNTGLVLYALVIWLTAALLRTFYQAAEPALQNKIMLGASFGSLLGNMMVVALVFAYGRDKPKNKGISFVFNLTLAIPLYLGYSMLMPGWYSWIGFLVICIILTIAEFHEQIRKMFQVVF